MRPTHDRSTVALIAWMTLTVTVATFFAPTVRAQGAASLAGRVFEVDGRTPRAGVTVDLIDREGNRATGSPPTTLEGSFAIDHAVPGQYRLMIQAQEGAFLTKDALEVTSGVNPPLALALTPGANYQMSSDPNSASGDLPDWAKWAIAGGIAVAALVVINQINDDEQPASNY